MSPPVALRKIQSDAEAGSSARQLSLDDPSELSFSSSATSALRTRPELPRWPGGLVGRAAGGRCCVWSFFIALAVLASFATLAVWQRVAKASGPTQPDGGEASGVCSIVLNRTVAEDGTDMSGWELSAQRWFPGDKRDDVSSYASVQNLRSWASAGVRWEVAPHFDEPGAYRIRIRQVETDGTSGEEIGWYLSAPRFYAKDERGLFSSYAAVVSEPTMIPVDDSEVGERMELLSENRTTAWPGASAASSAWVLVPLSKAGAYRIRLKTGPPGVEEMAGWYLSARRFFEKERRNEDSTYVSLVRDEDEATTWILKCSSCCVGMDAGTNGEEFPDFYK